MRQQRETPREGPCAASALDQPSGLAADVRRDAPAAGARAFRANLWGTISMYGGANARSALLRAVPRQRPDAASINDFSATCRVACRLDPYAAVAAGRAGAKFSSRLRHVAGARLLLGSLPM